MAVMAAMAPVRSYGCLFRSTSFFPASGLPCREVDGCCHPGKCVTQRHRPGATRAQVAAADGLGAGQGSGEVGHVRPGPPQNAVATPASLPFPLHLVPEASVLSLSGLLGWWHGHRGLSRSPMAVRGGPPVPGDCDPRPGSCLLSLIGWFPPHL